MGKILADAVLSAAALFLLTLSPLWIVAAPQSVSAPARTGTVFDVAAVRLNTSGSDKAYLQVLPGGRLEITNIPLRRLVILAYGIQDYQISGDPPSAASNHYDIQAKAEGNPSVQQMEGPMLKALLEDRFQLKAHREIRQRPVYELTVAKGGSKLELSKDGSCVPYPPDSPPLPPPSAGEPRHVFCGFPQPGVDGLNRTLDGAGITTEILAALLSRNYVSTLDRNVVDRTELTGAYDLHLKWAIEAPASEDVAASTSPSIFTALQEQLGLKLESTKGPVEVLVIDSVGKPTEN